MTREDIFSGTGDLKFSSVQRQCTVSTAEPTQPQEKEHGGRILHSGNKNNSVKCFEQDLKRDWVSKAFEGNVRTFEPKRVGICNDWALLGHALAHIPVKPVCPRQSSTTCVVDVLSLERP